MSGLENLIATVTAILVEHASMTTVRTWWAVSPDTARAVHARNDGSQIVLNRYPVLHDQRLLAKVRILRDGVALHNSSVVGPVAAAVTHLRLLAHIYQSDRALLCIRLVSFDVQKSQDFLAFWERHEEEEPLRIEELETDRLLPLISSHVRLRHRVPRALEAVRSIGLMNTVAVDANLEGAQYFPALEWLDASGEAVRFLRYLPSLTRLIYLDVSRTAIVNQDVLLIASLPSLQHLDLHSCEGVNDISLLQRASSLEWLNARDCMHLTRFSKVGYLPRLHFLDLSENNLGAAELTALLESPLPAAQVLLQQIRFPREPLREDITVMPCIHYLNLKGADFGLHVEVLGQLGPVEELVLDGSTITAAALEMLAPRWTHVRVLWLLRLDHVQLSCQFALAMEELTLLHMWRRTLLNESDIDTLKNAGISVILYDH